MRLTDEEAKRLYRERAPSRERSWSEHLSYHLGQMLEYTWNGKTISAQVRRGAVGSIINTDVFRAITISAGSVQELLAASPETNVSTEFYDCSSAVDRLLTKMHKNQAEIDDGLARRCFLMMFLAALTMKHACDSETPNNRSMDDTAVFSSNVYLLTPEEKILIERLPNPVFGSNMARSSQFTALSQNLDSLVQAV